MNRTLMERERCMRIHAGLPESFWAESVNHAAYLVNRSPLRNLEFKCAEEVWSNKSIDYTNLKVFGCSAYALIPSDKRSKLKPKSLECIFIEFESGVKGFKLWDPVNHKKILSRDVVFDEKTMPMNKIKNSEAKEDVVERETTIEVPLKKVFRETSQEQPTEDVQEEVESDIEEEDAGQQQQQTQEEEEAQEQVEPSSIARSRPKRTIKPPQRFGWDKDAVHYALNASEEEPTTFQEAVENKERESWMEAMMQEMESLHQNSVWELVPKPKGRKVIGCKWVFRKKEDMHGKGATIFKARLVAKGYLQKEGVDYDEIFSPVVKHTSIRLLLSFVAQENMEVEQMDVKTAFLHGDLEEDIYISQPQGFIEASKENLVCRLKKSLYGLKQSPRQWNKCFDSFMMKIGYRRCESDCCVYTHAFKDGNFILLLLYVDDMLIACKDMSKIQELKTLLGREFDMKDLGSTQKILGMEIRRDRNEGKLWLSQSKYISKVLEKFNMMDCKPVSTPLEEHFKLSAQDCPSTDEEKEDMSKVPYASLVGCLMYAMVCTRPDLAQAVSVVSRYMANPAKQHWTVAKWILMYLKGTKRIGILFERQQGKACVSGYVDSDYAGDLDKRRSTTGYVFICGGGPISWRAVLQSVSALSTTEAEYMALTEASKEAVWLKRLAKEFGIAQDLVVIQSDSQSAIHLVKNQAFHGRSKHIDVRYHRIRDWVNDGDIVIRKVHTNENASDCLTKPVTTAKFKHCLNLLNLVTC
ncbi:hypothetical protein CerSpe_126030 [Prunus speciosa]